MEREGSDVTLVAVSRMVGVALEAAAQLEGQGVSCEVLNLRSLRPLDHEAITSSAIKTHHVVSVEGGWPQYGVGSEIAAILMEGEFSTLECPAGLTGCAGAFHHSSPPSGPAFDYLDGPMLRVTGADVPMPYAANLEARATPQPDNVVSTVCALLGVQ